MSWLERKGAGRRKYEAIRQKGSQARAVLADKKAIVEETLEMERKGILRKSAA
jgi:ribosome-associated protein YbcJ (S4-like RNA binding protein)